MAEPGWTEGYRPRFPITVEPILQKLSRVTDVSINKIIARAALRDILRTEFEKNLDAFIDDLMRNGENCQVFKCGNE